MDLFVKVLLLCTRCCIRFFYFAFRPFAFPFYSPSNNSNVLFEFFCWPSKSRTSSEHLWENPEQHSSSARHMYRQPPDISPCTQQTHKMEVPSQCFHCRLVLFRTSPISTSPGFQQSSSHNSELLPGTPFSCPPCCTGVRKFPFSFRECDLENQTLFKPHSFFTLPNNAI